MIATEHQYRTTSQKLARFRAALESTQTREDVPSQFRTMQTRAIEEQIASLEAELEEYDELRSGSIDEIAISGLADLPKALVKARIARGLSQSELAELLGTKPQQVQRWEADCYSRIGFDHLKRIARELRIRMPQRLRLDGEPPVAPSTVRRAMVAAGLPREVFDRSIFPTRRVDDDDFVLADEIDARVRILFGVSSAAIKGGPTFQQTAMRFKLPASAAEKRTLAYAAYVEGICGIVAKCISKPTEPLPRSWGEMRSRLFRDGRASLRSAVEACWALGIAVIALNDPVAFHGACWRRNGRTVIVLKQTFPDEFRWLFDLIHELFHAVVAPDGDFMLVEADETSASKLSQEEKRANRFAAEVLTKGQLRTLTDQIVKLAHGSVPHLKSATLQVAKDSKLPAGLLANLLAQRLAEDPSNESWWSTAASLQHKDDVPWKIVRDVFLEHAQIELLDRIERDIVGQLLETPNE